MIDVVKVISPFFCLRKPGLLICIDSWDSGSTRITQKRYRNMDNGHHFGGGGAVGPVIRYFFALPHVTRVWFLSTVICTLMVNFDLIHSTQIDFRSWEPILPSSFYNYFVHDKDQELSAGSGRLEAWRIVTCFLYIGKFDWHTALRLHLLVQSSERYERMGPICTTRSRRRGMNPLGEGGAAAGEEHQQQQQQRRDNNNQNEPPYQSKRGQTSDYIFMLLLGMAGILLCQTILLPEIIPNSMMYYQHYYYYSELTYYVIYIWSKNHPNQHVNILGIMNIQAPYLPCTYLLMGYALNNGEVIPMDIVCGMVVGHIYYYLTCVVPTVLGGRAVLYTPEILIDICNYCVNDGAVAVEIDNNGHVVLRPELVDVDDVIGG